MEAKGWEFGPTRPCSRCGEVIYWGRNPQNGRNYSFDSDTTDYHFRHCGQPAPKPGPRDFVATPQQPASSSTPPPAPAPEENALQTAIAELALAVRALAAASPPSDGFARRAPGASSFPEGQH